MKIIERLKDVLHCKEHIEQRIESSTRNILFIEKCNELTSLALHTIDMGVSNQLLCNEEVVVSLTTHGARYYDCYLAIESIMQGTVKPNKIILWVSEELENEPIPVLLRNQIKRGLEIRFRKDIRSYTKLLYALKEFPDAAVITIDDDIIYSPDLVENLINTHLKRPSCICSNVMLSVPFDLSCKYRTLLDWQFVNQYLQECEHAIFEGYSGVLYPPHSLHEEVFDESCFMDICKYADDVWFSAMAMLNHTKMVCSYPHLGGFKYVNNENVQSVALANVNSKGEVLNDQQIKAVFSNFHLCGF